MQAAVALALLLVAGGAVLWSTRGPAGGKVVDTEISSQSKQRTARLYRPSDTEWATLTIETVEQRPFRTERATEGKIAVDEDRSTPIFSPYAGRVTKLLARPGDSVAAGQPLFMIEATDIVAAQNDFIAAISGLNKARSPLDDLRQVELRAAKQGPVRGQGGRAEGMAAVAERPHGGAERPALRRERAGSGAQPAAHPRPQRRRDQRLPEYRAHQRRDADPGADRRHHRAAQGRAGPVRQHQRERPGVRDRRPVHRLAGRLRARDRRRLHAGRPGRRLHGAGVSGSHLHGEAQLRGGRARPG